MLDPSVQALHKQVIIVLIVSNRSGSNRHINRYRNRKDDPLKVVGHIDLVTKEDLNWTASGWLASRCAGHCDDTVGMCYCGRESKHRRILAPPGSPLGTRPVQGGRPMVEPCKPKEDGKGGKADWGKHTIAQLYGPGGWCNADSKAQLVNVSGE